MATKNVKENIKSALQILIVRPGCKLAVYTRTDPLTAKEERLAVSFDMQKKAIPLFFNLDRSAAENIPEFIIMKVQAELGLKDKSGEEIYDYINDKVASFPSAFRQRFISDSYENLKAVAESVADNENFYKSTLSDTAKNLENLKIANATQLG